MLRSDRVSEEIKKVAAEIIQNEIEDPRLPDFTTVTAVEVTRDLSYATIYVSALGDGDQIQTTLDVMESAKKIHPLPCWTRSSSAKCTGIEIQIRQFNS